MKGERHLILGGARSGKTRYALNLATSLAEARAGEVIYVATAETSDDAEMQDRIMRHRRERPAHWRTLEQPRGLGRALAGIDSNSIILIDCLTLWLSNALLCDFRDDSPLAALPTWASEREELMTYLAGAQRAIVLVSNEVGGGLVPVTPVGRRFQSEQGWLNEAIAGLCERVTLVVAGIPMPIKTGSIPG